MNDIDKQEKDLDFIVDTFSSEFLSSHQGVRDKIEIIRKKFLREKRIRKMERIMESD